MGQGPPAGDVRIEELSHDGRGIARIEGKIAFIDGALPGERVRWRRTRRRGRFDEGLTENVLEPAAGRVEAGCRHFGTCGGCSLQHFSAAAQLAHKQAVVEEQLRHYGGIEPESWLAPLHGPAWGYRCKARLGVKHVPKKGPPLVGFREKRKRYVTELEVCEVLHPRIGRRLPALRALLDGLEARERIPQLEVSAGDGVVALVVRHLGPLGSADREALARFGREHDIDFYLQAGGPRTLEPLSPASTRELTYSLPRHDVEIGFGPTDFVQVNLELNRAMVDAVLGAMAPAPGERVLELYCGLGNFTLPLARAGAAVVGVEGDAALLARARANAARNGLPVGPVSTGRCGPDESGPTGGFPDPGGHIGVELEQCDLDEPAGPWLARTYEQVLLDPPRTGALPALRCLPLAPVRRITYVSCNPATLARDAGVLVHEAGFRLRRAGVIDMFPHTTHVESLAVFER